MNPLVFHCSPQQPGQMTPLSAAINAIFNSPGEAAAILFLIEDSSYMVPLCIRESVRSSSPSSTNRYPPGQGVTDACLGTHPTSAPVRYSFSQDPMGTTFPPLTSVPTTAEAQYPLHHIAQCVWNESLPTVYACRARCH